jgi:hypothetical protein
MREVGASLGVPIHVFGPETHMTAIVGMALGKTLSSAFLFLFNYMFAFIQEKLQLFHLNKLN